jgi:dienelactone hydrolase
MVTRRLRGASHRFRILTLVGLVILAFLLSDLNAKPHVHAFSLFVRAADLQGSLRRVADLSTVPISERLVLVQVPDGSVRARIYAPLRTSRQTVLLVSGLHPAGIDEPRLIAFARELAKTHVTVVTPDIPGLTQFAITPSLTDFIERAAVWLATDSGLAPTGRIGLIGVSFSGGLAVVAAGRPSLHNHVLYVLSVGGHHDLPRVLHYLCTGVESQPGTPIHSLNDADGRRPPHDYGLAIVLLGVADRLVPSDQVDALRALVRRFLWASYLDRTEKSRAAQEFTALRAETRTMPEPSATLLEYLNQRDVVRLGSRLLPYIGYYGNASALSPSRSPKPTAPVFLLHGRDDNVIPAVESQSLADDLRDHSRVRLLLTDLLSHAETDQPARGVDVLKLIAFWGDLLAET